MKQKTITGQVYLAFPPEGLVGVTLHLPHCCLYLSIM